MNIDDALKEMREAINFESHITMQINTMYANVMYVMQLVIYTTYF